LQEFFRVYTKFDPDEPDLEMEWTFRLRRKKQRIELQRREVRRNSNMAEGDQQRTLRDFVTPGVQGIASSIAHPAIDANRFELKPAPKSTPLDLFRGV